MTQRQLNTTSVYRRLSQVGLSVGLLIVVLSMWVDTAGRGERMQYENTSNHVRLMFKQSAQVAVGHLKANKTKSKTQALTQLLNDLSNDPYVLQSMVYDKTGKVLAKSDNAKTAHELYLEQRTLSETLPPYDPQMVAPPGPEFKMYVSEIMDGDKLLGYLHVSYLQYKALEKPLQFLEGAMHKILLMMLISGLIGFMLTRGFSRFSRQSYRIADRHRDI